MNFTYTDIAKMIDHSLLNPIITAEELDRGCKEAVAYGVASVCIMPFALKRCAELLAGSGVEPSTTIGFPHGGHTTAIKVAEARQAIADGGTELDMVINISKVRSGDWPYVEAKFAPLLRLLTPPSVRQSHIRELSLVRWHKIRLCEICGAVKADWVKTSTGYGTGATDDDLRLMAALPRRGSMSKPRAAFAT